MTITIANLGVIAEPIPKVLIRNKMGFSSIFRFMVKSVAYKTCHDSESRHIIELKIAIAVPISMEKILLIL